MTRLLIVLAILCGRAAAQPGATLPVGDPASNGAAAETTFETDASVRLDIDDLVMRAQAASPTLETIARGTFRRARRAVAFGPTAGSWAGAVPAQGEGEYAITFGLAVETFKVPVWPTPESLEALVIERARAKLREVIAASVTSNPPDPMTAEQFAREVWEEAVNEVLGLQNVRPKAIERPALNLAVEVNRLFESKQWAPRLRVGIGIWKLTLGASLAVGLGSDVLPKTPVYSGLELVGHVLLSKNPRASVVDVFVRADFELRNRNTNTDQLVLGLRYLLDVI